MLKPHLDSNGKPLCDSHGTPLMYESMTEDSAPEEDSVIEESEAVPDESHSSRRTRRTTRRASTGVNES